MSVWKGDSHVLLKAVNRTQVVDVCHVLSRDTVTIAAISKITCFIAAGLSCELRNIKTLKLFSNNTLFGFYYLLGFGFHLNIEPFIIHLLFC